MKKSQRSLLIKLLGVALVVALVLGVVIVGEAGASGMLTRTGIIATGGGTAYHSFCVKNADPGDTVTITAVCSDGNLDPDLFVTDPLGSTAYNDDGFTACNAFNSSIVVMPAVNGNWSAIVGEVISFALPAPYALNVSLSGSATFCTGASELPPGVWLADVCEPNDGFSDPEYGTVITIGSDAAYRNYGTTLYVGTSLDGPWTELDTPGPSYILTKAEVESLAADLGLADYHDLWFKVSPIGKPGNLGSMITDREQNMDSLCGG